MLVVRKGRDVAIDALLLCISKRSNTPNMCTSCRIEGQVVTRRSLHLIPLVDTEQAANG